MSELSHYRNQTQSHTEFFTDHSLGTLHQHVNDKKYGWSCILWLYPRPHTNADTEPPGLFGRSIIKLGHRCKWSQCGTIGFRITTHRFYLHIAILLDVILFFAKTVLCYLAPTPPSTLTPRIWLMDFRFDQLQRTTSLMIDYRYLSYWVIITLGTCLDHNRVQLFRHQRIINYFAD